MIIMVPLKRTAWVDKKVEKLTAGCGVVGVGGVDRSVGRRCKTIKGEGRRPGGELWHSA